MTVGTSPRDDECARSTGVAGRESWTVRFDISGVVESSITWTVRDGVLRVEGRRGVAAGPERLRTTAGERLYGRFLRLCRLPSNVDGDRFSAKVLAGSLELEAPYRAVRGARTHLSPGETANAANSTASYRTRIQSV